MVIHTERSISTLKTNRSVRGKFTDVLVRRADHRGGLFSSQTLGELKYLPVTDAVFRAEM